MKPYILFDLDGTLTDPAVGITDSAAYAFKKLGLSVPSKTELERFVGPPLNEIFPEFHPMDSETIKLAIKYFREYFSKQGIHDNELFSGCPELLAMLKANEATLFIATTKPTILAQKVLDRFDLAKYFSDVEGSPISHEGLPKHEVIANLLQRHKFKPQDAVMVGDRKYDILGAKHHNITSVGLLLGYGGQKELSESGADYIAANFDELGKVLMNM